MNKDQNKLDNLNSQILVYQSQGYHVVIKDENTYMAIMEKEGEQKAWVHILLLFVSWWLFLIPNIIYYYIAKKKKQIKLFG